MKKIKYLLLIAIISFFVLPGNISAAAPATLYQTVSWYGGMGTIQTNEMERGKTYSIDFFTGGGFFHPNEYLTFEFDDTILEIVEFHSYYGFEYNNGKIKLEGNKLLEEGFSTRETARLWDFEVKVKENAKLGKTKINGVLYEIVCGEDEECSQDNNNEEIQKPNNSTQEDNSNSENNNGVVQKPDNNNNDNNQENNENDKIILDDTKFYVLAGLFGTTVIELLVLILKKTKKA